MSLIPLARSLSLSKLVERYGGQLDRELADRSITQLADVRDPGASDTLAVVASWRFLAAAANSASCLLCSPEHAKRLNQGRRWVLAHPLWVFAELLELARPDWHTGSGVSANAVIDPRAVVHPGATIKEGCRVAANAVIYAGVLLEASVHVGAGAVLGRSGFGFATGPNGEQRKIPQLGGVHIEQNVEVGALCTVDAGTLRPTRVGRDTKLDAQVHVGHNVTIGQRCMVAAQVGFAGSVEIGDDVWIGGQSGVADHVRVGRGARIAAKSGVISDVPEAAVVAGFPSQPRFRWLRQVAWAARLGKRSRARVVL
jgi:UDP-3-O-[3-hydroxymyristoyl] glucosamine N-acyltransferase